MTRVDDERAALRALPSANLEGYLIAHSGLPGPRANLELLAAFIEEAPLDVIRRYASLRPEEAPRGTSREFLALCGAAGMGRLLDAEDERARTDAWATVRRLAADERWRVREGVAIGLQRFGRSSFRELCAELAGWADGGLLECRAVVAALCEPDLLRDPGAVWPVLALLDRITERIAAAAEAERRTEAFRVLRTALGYGWSVAIAADPQAGVAVFRRWIESSDRDVAWIVRENRAKKRLAAVAGLLGADGATPAAVRRAS